MTIFDADSEESPDLDLVILTALLKGECLTRVTCLPRFLFSRSVELSVFYVDILNRIYACSLLYPRHKFSSIRTIKSGNGLGQNGHCQETYPNLWTTLEGIVRMKLFGKNIWLVREGQKKKNRGEKDWFGRGVEVALQ